MSERELDEERRLRRAAVTRHGPVQPDPEPTDPADQHAAAPAGEDDNAAAQRMEQKTLWVDLQIRKAIARGEFDDLPGAGKPLNLPDRHDPDWWVKRLIEREKLSGVAPPAIGLRREDAELDTVLDREVRESGVRRVVDDFNRRVVEARRQLTGGPPVITRTRDADSEVEAWRARRATALELARKRRVEAQARAAADADARRGERPRRWWRRSHPR